MLDSRESLEPNEEDPQQSGSNRKDFSFNRTDTHKSSRRSALKLEEIRHELKQLDAERLCELLIREIQHNEDLRAELLRADSKYEGCREEIRLLSQSLAFKKESFLMLSENQTKNEQQITKLEQELKSFKGRYNLQSWTSKVDSEWHRKYNQLARHMDIYVENSKEVQEEFARQREISKKELEQIYHINAELNLQIRQLTTSNAVQAEQLKAVKLEAMEATKALEEVRHSSEEAQQQKVFRLEQALVASDEQKTELEERCQRLTSDVGRAAANAECLQQQLTRMEALLSKERQASETNRLTTERHLQELRIDREKLEVEISTLRIQQTSRQPIDWEVTELRAQNEKLREQLDASYKTIGSLKAEVILLKGEADRARSQVKRQAEKNNEIRQELDRFCRKKRDTASPDNVLSQLQTIVNSVPRKQYISSQQKVEEFRIEEHSRNFTPGKENRISCIIGEDGSQ